MTLRTPALSGSKSVGVAAVPVKGRMRSRGCVSKRCEYSMNKGDRATFHAIDIGNIQLSVAAGVRNRCSTLRQHGTPEKRPS